MIDQIVRRLAIEWFNRSLCCNLNDVVEERFETGGTTVCDSDGTWPS